MKSIWTGWDPPPPTWPEPNAPGCRRSPAPSSQPFFVTEFQKISYGRWTNRSLWWSLIFGWYLWGGTMVLMLEEEEDLQAKPVSESLGKLWMRAATAKLYLVFYIYLRHYDLSYVPEEGHVCHPWSAWVSSLLRLCLQSCCQPQDWLHLLLTWSSSSSSSSSSCSSSSPSSSSSSSSSPSTPKVSSSQTILLGYEFFEYESERDWGRSSSS